jgi:hypothetical protein
MYGDYSLGSRRRLTIANTWIHVGPILKRPVRIQDGNVLISEEPGARIEWNEELSARIVR